MAIIAILAFLHWHLVSRIYENKPFKTFLVPVDPEEVNLFENSETAVQPHPLGEV